MDKVIVCIVSQHWYESNFEDIIYSIVDEYTYLDEYDACNMVIFIKIRNKYRQHDSASKIVAEFEVLGTQTLENNKYELYNKSYSYFNGAFTPETNKKISAIYYITLSEHLIEMEKTDSLVSLPYLDSAYSIAPDDNRVMGIILNCMGTQIIDMTMEMGDDYKAMMNIVEGYSNRFKGIDDNSSYNYVYCYALTRTIYELCSNGMYRSAEPYYDKLLAYMKKHEVKKLDSGTAPYVLKDMSHWYMLKYEDKGKALEPILLGLKYFPDNKMLLLEKERLSN